MFSLKEHGSGASGTDYVIPGDLHSIRNIRMTLHRVGAVENLRTCDEVEINCPKWLAPVPVAVLMLEVVLVAAQRMDEAVTVELPGADANRAGVDGFDLEHAAAGGELFGREGREVEARRQ